MKDLAPILTPLITRELATIGALDTAISTEREPDYVILFHASKQSKQSSVEQMLAMLRSSGDKQTERGTFVEFMLKMQTSLLEKIGTTPPMRAMRLTERDLVSAYADAYDQLDGIDKRGLLKCWHRAIKRYTVLTAHIGKRGHLDVEEILALPLPITQYFANDEPRACMRCLFDRPGHNGPLMRTDPHPYAYICAACHDEIIPEFSADLLEKMPSWSQRDRESRIIEKALSRPAKLKAELLVLAKMSAIAPDMPPAPVARKTAGVSVFDTSLPEPRPSADLQVVNNATTNDERLYTELLFDFESVRQNW